MNKPKITFGSIKLNIAKPEAKEDDPAVSGKPEKSSKLLKF